MPDFLDPAKHGTKHIPDLVLRQVIPHLAVMYPPIVRTGAVRPEDAPALSFEAGQQSVIAALRAELQARQTKG